MRTVEIHSWLKPFPHTNGIAVVFDIFRCSTTIYCATSLKPAGVWVAPSIQSLSHLSKDTHLKNFTIFSELPESSTCFERFDNSPTKVLAAKSTPSPNVLVATTTGTPAMFAAKSFSRVLVGSLVSLSRLLQELRKFDGPITLIPAAIPEWAHVEDEIVANCVKSALEKNLSSHEEIHTHAQKYIEQIHASGRPAQLTKKLAGTGCDDDVPICLDTDRFSFLAEIDFSKAVQDTIAPIVKKE